MPFPRRTGLRIRALVLLLLAGVPLAGVVGWNVIAQRRMAAEDAEREGIRAARLAAAPYGNIVTNARRVLAALAEQPEVAGLDARGCHLLLERELSDQPDFANLLVVLADGRVVCSPRPFTNVDAADPLLRAVLQSGRFRVRDGVAERFSDRPTLDVAWPILDATGGARGAVAAALGTQRLAGIVENDRPPDGWSVAVIAGSSVLATAGPAIPRVQPRASTWWTPVRMYASVPVAGTGTQPRLHVVASIPASRALAAANALARRSIAGLAIGAAFVFAAWILVDRLLIHRVRSLTATAARLTGAGQRAGGNELAALDAALDAAGGALQSLRAELHELEAARRGAERRVSQVLDVQADAVVIMDAERSIIHFNRGAELMFGHRAAEVAGKPFETLFPLQQHDTLRRAIQDRLADDDHRANDHEQAHGVHRDGAEFPVEVSFATLADDDRTLVVATVRDLTERTRGERELRMSIETLQRTDEHRRRLLGRLVRAQEEERKRLASDVHDDSIQTMASAGMRLHALGRRIADPDHAALIDEIKDAVRQATVRLRRLLFDLWPPELESKGVVNAVRAYLDQVAPEAGYAFDVHGRLGREPPPETGVIVYRIVQEALANVAQHAEAGRVDVTIEERDGGYAVRVRDDGRGFAASDPKPGHLGLTSMRERAEIGGGWLRVTSEPGAGTEIEFWLPSAEGST